jgi:hypothetical protein
MSLSSNETVRRWLGPGLVTAGALLGAVALWVASQGEVRPSTVAAEVGTPELRVDRETIDFGRVAMGQWVEATFTLTNTGDGSLRFHDEPWVEIAAGC